MSDQNQTKMENESNSVELFNSTSVYLDTYYDIISGAKKWRIWITLAWQGLKQRYRRSWLSVSWIMLSFALLITVKMFIFGALSSRDISFFAPYLASGYLVFRLVSNFITQGASIFISSQSWIKSEPLPLSIHVFKLMGSTFIQFFFMSIPTLIVCVYTDHFHAIILLLLPVILFIYAINGLWISAVMGVLCTRHRDIRYFVATAVMVLYFMTPVLWVPPATGMRAVVAKYNPITHFIEILRSPLLTGEIAWQSMQIVSIITCLGIVFSFLVFAINRKKIIFWL